MSGRFFCALLAKISCAGVCVLGGCNLEKGFLDVGVRSWSRSESVWGDKHTVTHRSGTTTRTIEYSGKVVWDDGKVQRMPRGGLIKLFEKKAGGETAAEIRESDGEPQLWIREGREFRRATASQDAWLKNFLQTVRIPADMGAVELAVKSRIANPEYTDFLAQVRGTLAPADRVALMLKLAQAPHLSPKQQVALIEACFREASFDSDRVSLLLALLKRPDFSPAAKKALRAKVDQLAFDSSKITVLKELSAK